VGRGGKERIDGGWEMAVDEAMGLKESGDGV